MKVAYKDVIEVSKIDWHLKLKQFYDSMVKLKGSLTSLYFHSLSHFWHYFDLFGGLKMFSTDSFGASHKMRLNFRHLKWNKRLSYHKSLIIWQSRLIYITLKRAEIFKEELIKRGINHKSVKYLDKLERKNFDFKKEFSNDVF
jgi:hypothetical protein